jgi:hypothetical protein
VLEELACVAEALIEARAVALRAAEAAEERRMAVEGLERERRQFKQAERMAEMGSYRYDIETRSTSWSDGVFVIHEMPVSGGVPIGAIMNFFPEPDRALFRAAVRRVLDTGEPFEMDADFVTAKGNARRVRCSCEIELVKGKPVALIGLIQDITERHSLEQRLRHQARTDDLTQLANRAEFHRALDARLREARASDDDVAVLLIDLDALLRRLLPGTVGGRRVRDPGACRLRWRGRAGDGAAPPARPRDGRERAGSDRAGDGNDRPRAVTRGRTGPRRAAAPRRRGPLRREA